MEPVFRRRADGTINLNNSHDADRCKARSQPWTPALSPQDVLKSARQAAAAQGLDPNNEACVLGCHTLQFGSFKGQTFRWLLENALGYGGYLVASMMKESEAGEVKDHPNNRANKEAFRKYMEMFPEGRGAISVKYQRFGSTTTTSSRAAPHTSHGPASATSSSAAPSASDDDAPSTSAAPVSARPSAAPSTSGALPSRAVPSTSRATASLKSLLVGKDFSQRTLEKSVKRLFSPPSSRLQPCKYSVI